jgi:hypothetical protein
MYFYNSEFIHVSPNSGSTAAVQLDIEVGKKFQPHSYIRTRLTDMSDKSTVNLQETDRAFIDYLDQNMLGSKVFVNIFFNFFLFANPLYFRSLPIFHRHN